MEHSKILSLELGITEPHAQNIIALIDEGCTIPFIARYRKEMTGSCDDQTLRAFSDRLNYLRNLDKRKEEVSKLIGDQGKLTDELKAKIENANTLTELDDIYRPFRPKRQTRATIAIAKGLEPLADIIMAQKLTQGDPLEIAKEYVHDDEDEKKKVATPQDALQGALDIIAERISDDADLRKELREFMQKTAVIETELKPAENAKTYDMYDGKKEAIKTIPSHRILAINRGENEKCLKVAITANKERCLEFVEKHYLKRESIFIELLKTTFEDSFDRLIMPSLDTELRNELTDRANEQAIKMFKVNLKPLLMQPPLKHKRILGFDPGYRTGCKLAVIDENGKVLDKGVVFATPPQSKIEESEKIILNLIDKYKIDCISIGKLPLGALEEIKLGVELCATDYVAREIKIRIDLTKSLREAQNEISSSKLKDMLIDLADNLPEQTPNFYNSLGMEKLHSKIDNITDYIIYHSPETLSYKQDFDDIVKEKDDMIKNYCYRNDYKLPTESVGEKMMRDLYRRLGNIIIQKAKEIKFADIQRMKLDARYRYQKQMEKNKRKQLFNECLYLSMKCNYEAIKAFQDYMRKLEEIHIKRLMEEGVLDAEDFHFEM